MNGLMGKQPMGLLGVKPMDHQTPMFGINGTDYLDHPDNSLKARLRRHIHMYFGIPQGLRFQGTADLHGIKLDGIKYNGKF